MDEIVLCRQRKSSLLVCFKPEEAVVAATATLNMLQSFLAAATVMYGVVNEEDKLQ